MRKFKNVFLKIFSSIPDTPYFLVNFLVINILKKSNDGPYFYVRGTKFCWIVFPLSVRCNSMLEVLLLFVLMSSSSTCLFVFFQFMS